MKIVYPRLLLLAAMAALTAAAWPGTAAAWTQSVIHDFCAQRFCVDGRQPEGPLTMGPSGEFYGTTFASGPEEFGNVFKLAFNPAKNAWKLTVLYQFCPTQPCLDGAYPSNGVIVDTEGNLYGTTVWGGPEGGGVAFELVRATPGHKPAFKLLYDFCSLSNCADGSDPSSNLTYAGASAGQLYDGVSPLYGVTRNGGVGASGDAGALYQLTPQDGSWSESVLYSFCSQASCSDGGLPRGLLLDGSGHFFGVGGFGGATDAGVIYRVSFDGSAWTETVLHDFCQAAACADGAVPLSDLTIDAAGNLFGTTHAGGKKNAGTLYRLAPNAHYKVLHQFCSERDCRDGANPLGDLVLDASGNLFGVAQAGGGHDLYDYEGGGTAFKFDGTALTPIHGFCARRFCTDGDSPSGALSMDAAGNLFGTTSAGGRGGAGTVFEISP